MLLPRTAPASAAVAASSNELAAAAYRLGRLPPRLRTSGTFHASANSPVRTVCSTRLSRPAASLTSSLSRSNSRSIHLTPSLSRFHFLLSHAVQGKPPEPEPQYRYVDEKGVPLPDHLQPVPPQGGAKKQIGWPKGTAIGEWRESLLGGAEAGEDAMMVADISNDPAKGVAIGVADGVGSWSQNGIDPSLFS